MYVCLCVAERYDDVLCQDGTFLDRQPQLLLCLDGCWCTCLLASVHARVFCVGVVWCLRACVCVGLCMSVVLINILLKHCPIIIKHLFYFTLIAVDVHSIFEYCWYFAFLYVYSCSGDCCN